MTSDYPLSIHPSIFIGRKPVAVLIGGEIIPTPSWRKVYKEILQHCIKDLVYHERLMSLRGKLAGKERVFISSKPDTMSCPLKICEEMYGEVHYGSQTLMRILTERILTAINFDYSDIKIRLSNDRKKRYG